MLAILLQRESSARHPEHSLDTRDNCLKKIIYELSSWISDNLIVVYIFTKFTHLPRYLTDKLNLKNEYLARGEMSNIPILTLST